MYVAVDPSNGDVYIADTSDQVIDRFNSANEYQSQLTSIPVRHALAVDSSGNTYVADTSAEGVYEFNSAGTQVLHIASPSRGSFEELRGIAIDSSNNIYLAESGHTIYEFSSSGSPVAQLTRTPTEQLPEPHGVAVDAAGDIYVVGGEVVDVFGPSVVVPDVNAEPATGVTQTTATVNGTVEPDGVPLAGCQFEYGITIAYGQSVSCEIGSGSTSVPVAAKLKGLQVNTAYHFRITVTNANGANASSDETFTTLGPGITEEAARNVTITSAMIGAEVDPVGVQTTYYVEYGTTPVYGSVTAVEDAGTGVEAKGVQVQLTGLQPGTFYHYRLVASNDLGITDGSDLTFTTFATVSDALPDGRQYELVSPPNKNGGEIDGGLLQELVAQPVQASENGNAVTYESSSGFESAPGQDKGSVEVLTYLSRRTPSGWLTENITVPYEAQGHIDPAVNNSTDSYEAMSSDLSTAFVVSNSPLLGGSFRGYMMPYRRDNESSTYRALSPVAPSERIAGLYTYSREGAFVSYFAGASSIFPISGFPQTRRSLPKPLLAPARKIVICMNGKMDSCGLSISCRTVARCRQARSPFSDHHRGEKAGKVQG